MYSKEVWDEVIRLHIEEGRTYKSLSEEFGMNPATISKRVVKLRNQSQKDAMKAKSLEDMEEIRRLREELAETKKEKKK